jgi:hypothetical protein
MSGGMPSVKVVLRNPLNYSDQIDYTIIPHDNPLARDWIFALKELLQSKNLLEKNFCFMGFPKSARTLEYLCHELNEVIFQINKFNSTLIWQQNGLTPYVIEDYFTPDVVRFGEEYEIGTYGNKICQTDEYYFQHLGLQTKQGVMNRLHNHFEILQGTVSNLSDYYRLSDYETKYAIRQINNLCHELENLLLSQQKQKYMKEWIRPSQITTWLQAPRYDLKDEHREGFISNKFDRKFGHVYMHWAQIGKTYYEVFRDEDAPELTDTVCEAITQLKFYSGEFDVEWGKDTVANNPETPWVKQHYDNFRSWMIANNKDPDDKNLSNGYLPLGEIDIKKDFGTTDKLAVWDILSKHLDIYKIEIDGVTQTYDYCWNDHNYKQMQIDMMRPGYDFSSRR